MKIQLKEWEKTFENHKESIYDILAGVLIIQGVVSKEIFFNSEAHIHTNELMNRINE